MYYVVPEVPRKMTCIQNSFHKKITQIPTGREVLSPIPQETSLIFDFRPFSHISPISPSTLELIGNFPIYGIGIWYKKNKKEQRR